MDSLTNNKQQISIVSLLILIEMLYQLFTCGIESFSELTKIYGKVYKVIILIIMVYTNNIHIIHF